MLSEMVIASDRLLDGVQKGSGTSSNCFLEIVSTLSVDKEEECKEAESVAHVLS